MWCCPRDDAPLIDKRDGVQLSECVANASMDRDATKREADQMKQAEARLAQRKLDCLENSILLVHQAAMKMRII